MLVSKEVLCSVQSSIEFYNIDELFNLEDIEQIQNRNERESSEKCLYWLDYEGIIESDIQIYKGIILISPKNFKFFNKKQLAAFKIIISEDPANLFYAIAEFFMNEEIIPKIHPTAIIEPGTILGNNIYIGPYAEIDLCEIGDNCIIHSHCSIGRGVKIGNNTTIHSGAKIGFSIFSFKQNPTHDWAKYQQIAGVNIGDNVTIGSNTCINNGFIKDTIINDNAFIDSLCQIQGSVTIGSNTIIAAKAFIASSVTIGQRCWIAPNVSIRENIKISDDVFIGIGSVVLRSIKKSSRVFGVPAQRIDFS